MGKTLNRWQVLIASTVILLCTGAVYAFSVFAGPLSQTKGWSIPAIMMAFTINAAIGPIPSILGGYFTDKGYAKWSASIGGVLFGLGYILTSYADSLAMLYFSYGILAGLGQGFAYSACLNNTIRLFPDKKGLASGIITAGMGGAAIIAAPIANKLIESSGVLYAFKVMGITYVAIVLVATIFIKKAPANYVPEGWTPPKSQMNFENKNWLAMIKTPAFYLIISMLGIGAFSGLMIASNASVIGQKMFMLSAATAAFYVSLYSLSNTLGRVVWGAVSDKLGREKTLIIIFTVIACSLFVLTLGKSVTIFAIGVIGLGLCFGGVMGVFPSLVMENFGPRFQGVNYGIVFIGYSTSAFFAPKVTASIGAANNGDYTNAFYIAVGLALVGLLINLAYIKLKKTK